MSDHRDSGEDVEIRRNTLDDVSKNAQDRRRSDCIVPSEDES